MSSTNNNKLWYALLGAGAFVVGAFAFYYVSSNKGGQSAILEEIEGLGEVEKDRNGILTFKYFKNVFTIAQKHSKLKFIEEKKSLIAKRRRALKEGNMAEYQEIVKELLHKEEGSF